MSPAPSTAPIGQQDLMTSDCLQHCASIENHAKDSQQHVSTPSISQCDSALGIASESVNRSSSRFYHHGKRISAKLIRPFKLLDMWIQARMRRSRFHGWRMGVLIGAFWSTFVLCCNIIAVGFAVSTAPKNQGSIVDIMIGSAESVSWWSKVLHLVINIFSTTLLAASNYTAQVLCSPTRLDLDAAHRKGTWLDVGLVSMRNFRYLPRERVILSFLLSVSSLPLHLVYNAAIIEVAGTSPTQYWIYAIDTKSATWASLNSSSRVETFGGNEWWDIFNKEHLSTYGDLYLGIDQVAFESHPEPIPNAPSTLLSQYLPTMRSRDSFTDMNPNNSLPWINYSGFRPIVSTYSTWPRTARVAQSFATLVEVPSRIQLSRDFMLVVICVELLKLIIMVCVLVTDRSDYLVTLGDALASYLQQPDPITEGKCMLDKAGHRFISGERVDLGPEVDDHANFRQRLDGIWRPRRLQYSMLLPEDRQQIFVIPFICTIGAVTMLPAIVRDFDAWADTRHVEGGGNQGIIWNVWFDSLVANSPQVVLSFCYLAFDNICTCMASTQEWNQLTQARKGLRVSRPMGKQRETYFLQLPYKYAVPLMLVSVVLHWLLSQAFYIQREDYYGGTGTSNPFSRRYYSTLRILVLLIIALVLLIVVGFVGSRRMHERVPPAASCSLVISAACHPPKTDVDAHLKKVKWGAVRGLDAEGFGHCCLTGESVTKPEVGARYR